MEWGLIQKIHFYHFFEHTATSQSYVFNLWGIFKIIIFAQEKQVK